MSRALPEITWVEPTYKAVLAALRHPAYAGTYVYGPDPGRAVCRRARRLRTRRRDLPSDQWEVLIPRATMTGWVFDWDTYQDVQHQLGRRRPAGERRPGHRRGPGGLTTELQILASCGVCGAARPPSTTTGSRRPRPATIALAAQREPAAAAGTFGSAAPRSTPRSPGRSWPRSPPPGCRPGLTAAGQLKAGYDIALDQHRRQVEQARYRAAKAERRYRAVDPENRLVARGLETQWEHALQAQSDAEAELTRREKARPATLTSPGPNGPRSLPS